MTTKTTFDLNPDVYDRNMRRCETVANYIGLKLHTSEQTPGTLQEGNIFVFNHFTRFETAIPPYLIHQETGAYCRSIAAHQLFNGSQMFTQFLWDMGAIPNRYQGLLPYLAAEILRGRKIVIFPEGGLIKDKQVLDDDGEFNIFSPKDQTYRKQHRGAAVLALVLDLFKHRILDHFANNDHKRIEHWQRSLGLESPEELLKKAQEPTLIVPSTITFFPLRIGENLLSRSMEVLCKNPAEVLLEELTIEGNMLFKPTDMHVHFGESIPAHRNLSWMEKTLLKRYFSSIYSLDELFRLRSNASTWSERFLEQMINKDTRQIRDAYMAAIYRGITINVNHLAARLMVTFMERGVTTIPKEEFHKALYMTLKTIQNAENVNLHPSITEPARYRGILKGETYRFQSLLKRALKTEVVTLPDKENYHFTDKLLEPHHRGTIRTENPVIVTANEAAPITAVDEAIHDTLKRLKSVNKKDLAALQFEDDVQAYEDARHTHITPKEALHCIEERHGKPYLLLPSKKAKIGILLIHGLTASPGELKTFGKQLHKKGYAVLGTRLPGHGTTPADLATRDHTAWLEGVRRSYNILAEHVDYVAIVGFSTGALLGLQLASEHPQKLAGVASVSAPMGLRNPFVFLTPIMAAINSATQKLFRKQIYAYYKDKKPTAPTNYDRTPICTIRDLRAAWREAYKALPYISAPTLVMQGTRDVVIKPSSAEYILQHLRCNKQLHTVDTAHHRIITKDVGDTRKKLEEFLEGLET